MSRVEPKEPRRSDEKRQAEENPRRQPVDRTPSKAEGEENTVDEALERQEREL